MPEATTSVLANAAPPEGEVNQFAFVPLVAVLTILATVAGLQMVWVASLILRTVTGVRELSPQVPVWLT